MLGVDQAIENSHIVLHVSEVLPNDPTGNAHRSLLQRGAVDIHSYLVYVLVAVVITFHSTKVNLTEHPVTGCLVNQDRLIGDQVLESNGLNQTLSLLKSPVPVAEQSSSSV